MTDPPLVLVAAAVLAAEGVRFVLVGSAALWLRGVDIRVHDVDLVVAPDAANLDRLRAALRRGTVPAGDIVPVTTPYGPVDLLLARGRTDHDRLLARGGPIDVLGVPLQVASLDDALALRRAHKGVA